MRILRGWLIAMLLVVVIMTSFVMFGDGSLPSAVSIGLIGLVCGVAGTFLEEKLFA